MNADDDRLYRAMFPSSESDRLSRTVGLSERTMTAAELTALDFAYESDRRAAENGTGAPTLNADERHLAARRERDRQDRASRARAEQAAFDRRDAPRRHVAELGEQLKAQAADSLATGDRLRDLQLILDLMGFENARDEGGYQAWAKSNRITNDDLARLRAVRAEMRERSAEAQASERDAYDDLFNPATVPAAGSLSEAQIDAAYADLMREPTQVLHLAVSDHGAVPAGPQPKHSDHLTAADLDALYADIHKEQNS